MANSHRAEMLASSVLLLNFTLSVLCPGPIYSTFAPSLGVTPFLSIPVTGDPYLFGGFPYGQSVLSILSLSSAQFSRSVTSDSLRPH